MSQHPTPGPPSARLPQVCGRRKVWKVEAEVGRWVTHERERDGEEGRERDFKCRNWRVAGAAG